MKDKKYQMLLVDGLQLTVWRDTLHDKKLDAEEEARKALAELVQQAQTAEVALAADDPEEAGDSVARTEVIYLATQLAVATTLGDVLDRLDQFLERAEVAG